MITCFYKFLNAIIKFIFEFYIITIFIYIFYHFSQNIMNYSFIILYKLGLLKVLSIKLFYNYKILKKMSLYIYQV